METNFVLVFLKKKYSQKIKEFRFFFKRCFVCFIFSKVMGILEIGINKRRYYKCLRPTMVGVVQVLDSGIFLKFTKEIC